MTEVHIRPVIKLRPMKEDDCVPVLAMRNHPSIRRCMLNQHEILLNEHISWFKQTSNIAQAELLILEVDAMISGFVQFKLVDRAAVRNWGFYSAPWAPKGTGRILCQLALRHIFHSETIQEVCGQSFAWNTASIKLHLALGFAPDAVSNQIALKEAPRNNLIHFKLSKQDWNLKQISGEKN